jgi:hypothetical protein
MSQVTITFDTDNSAFEDNPFEVEEILEKVGTKLKDVNRIDVTSFKVIDSNGNTIGKVEVS